MKNTRCLFLLLVLALCVAMPGFTRPVSGYDFTRLGKEAVVLLTGEVVKTAAVGAIAAQDTHWHIPLTRMRAEVKVLRVAPAAKMKTPAIGTIITVGYEALAGQIPPDGPNFPRLIAGQACVFPLRKAVKERQAEFEFINEENWGLQVPALKNLISPAPKDNVEFLTFELANVFANGSDAEIDQAARYYISNLYTRPLADAVAKRLDATINNQRRWLQIAVTVYSRSGTPRPTLTALATGAVPNSVGHLTLVSTALAHIDPAKRDVLLIDTALQPTGDNAGMLGMLLAVNYPRHPHLIQRLSDMLAHDAPGSLVIAAAIVYTHQDSVLKPATLATAAREIKRRDGSNGNEFHNACTLIRDFGTNAQFAVLLAEIAAAKKADITRYKALWENCAYNKGPRAKVICRLYLDDRREAVSGYRFCDLAAGDLQYATGVNFFVVKSNPTRAQRDTAVKRAQAWLKVHP